MILRPLNLTLSIRVLRCKWPIVALLIIAALPEHTIVPMAADPPQYALVNLLFDSCLKKKFPHVDRHPALAAFDPDSGRNFAYDKEKQAWIYTKTGEVVCPGSRAEPQYALVNLLFDYCLKKKFPHVERHPPLTAFDPDSGRNFAWDADKQAWIDVKTLECMCPKCPETAAQTTPTPTPATAETTTPKSANEPQKVEEKKEPSWWETLIPALIPSIGIGVGRERERREPRNPCAGK